MCGIAGFLCTNPTYDASLERSRVETMVARLQHRGPDQHATVAYANCVIGNARLTVTDLTDNGALPWIEGKQALAYNGALYNEDEMRAYCASHNDGPWRSDSDAEVVFRRIQDGFNRDQPIRAIQDLVGHFGLCFVDAERKKAIIARDLMGPRPLFYHQSNHGLYFASEIKALLTLPTVTRNVNHQGIYDYLSLAYIPGSQTAFTDITEVGPGHYIMVDLATGNVDIDRFADTDFAANPDIKFEEAVETVRAAMVKAVERSINLDAPIGSTLSGGIDTSAICGVAGQHIENLKTYSISMDDVTYDESYYQRIVAKAIGAEHHEIVVGAKDTLDAWADVTHMLDEPLGDGAAIPSYLLAKVACQDVKVLLSGEGGDEVFNAYETHGAALARNMYRGAIPKPIRSMVRAIVHKLPTSHKKLSFDFVAKRFVDGVEMDVCDAHLHWRHALRPDLRDAMLTTQTTFQRPERWFWESYNRVQATTEMDRISAVDLEHFLVGDLMVKNDRTFMAHSIEGRFPWLDQELAALMRTMPSRWRIKNWKDRRYLEKQAMKPYLPNEIYTRSNMGLELPHAKWFVGPWKDWLCDTLAPSNVKRLGWLNEQLIDKLVQQHLARSHDHSRALWCMCNIIGWYDHVACSSAN